MTTRTSLSFATIIATGLAIFSMFFGAGNLIFPIDLGRRTGINVSYGCIGLIITGVIFALIGLLAIILYRGDHNAFFGRVGTIPGFLSHTIILVMLGPLTAIPRAIDVLYGLCVPLVITSSVFHFILLFLGITFLATYRRERVMPLLGYIISPLLVVLLFIIFGSVVWNEAPLFFEAYTPLQSFARGIREGYATMDLMAALHFAPLATFYLRRLTRNKRLGTKSIIKVTLFACTITGILLSLIYIGLSYIGAAYGHNVITHNPAELTLSITQHILSPYMLPFFYLLITLAITSTAISLTTIFTDFLRKQVFHEHVTHTQALLLTLFLTGISAHSGLHAILRLETPFLMVFYPPLIILVICNIAYKLIDFKPVKLPVALALVASIVNYWIQ